MNAIQQITCASLVLASFGGGAPAWAAEVSRDFAVGINEANATLRGGDVDGALQKYADVREFAPESADLSYNMAVAQYRKGDMAAAEQLFQSAAASENDSLAAKARYNLGNCNYANGLELSQKDRPAAIKQLESAIDNYRSSLAVDSSNADARANIELASRLIDQLREQEKQKQKQQNQQNQQQDQQQQSNNQQQDSQDEQSQDQQNQDQQQSEEQNSQSSQGDDEQQQQDQQQSSAQEGQQQENQKQDQQEQSQQDQAKQNESQDQESRSDEPRRQQADQNESQSQPQQRQDAQPRDQQQQSQHPQQQPPQEPSPADEANENQGERPPQGELTTANEQEAQDGKDQKQIAMFDPSKDGEMTQQEAEKMLQAIRDRDMQRRYQRQRQELQRHVPVERDW